MFKPKSTITLPPGNYLYQPLNIVHNDITWKCENSTYQNPSLSTIDITYQDKKLAVNGKTCTIYDQRPQTHPQPQTSITNKTGYNLYMWGLDRDLIHNNTVNFDEKTTALQIRPKTETGFVKCSDTNLKNLVKQNKKNEITYDATLNKLKINGNVCAG